MKNEKLERIVKKYEKINFNDDNYSVGGGLSDSGKKASNRHEDALSDEGKLTLGKVNAMFKRATGLEISEVKTIINFVIPSPEWHHAGFLPKSYGGGMKKTYFLNSAQIIDLAKNWQDYSLKLETQKSQENKEAEFQVKKDKVIENFLSIFAYRIEREENIPLYFYQTNCEMDGKYGWFAANSLYNMTEYYSGWGFYNEAAFDNFDKIRSETINLEQAEILINSVDMKPIFVKISKNKYFKILKHKWSGKGKIITRATYNRNIKRLKTEEEQAGILRTVESAQKKANKFIADLEEKEKKRQDLQTKMDANKDVKDFADFFKQKSHPAPSQILKLKSESGLSWRKLSEMYSA